MNKCVKFNNKTEVNGEYLNTMVKKAVTAALKEKKNAPAWSQRTSTNIVTKMRILALTALI